MKGIPIPETVVEAVSQGHFDWTRRLRPDKQNPVSPEKLGYEVLRQSSPADRGRIARDGMAPLLPGYCISVDV